MDGDNRGAWSPRLAFFNTIGTIIGALTGAVAILLLVYLEFLSSPQVQYEWTLPARFNGQGAITMGCALWYPASVTPYSKDNPNEQFAAVAFSTLEGLKAYIQGPMGSVFVEGRECALSVDWSAIPYRERARE